MKYQTFFWEGGVGGRKGRRTGKELGEKKIIILEKVTDTTTAGYWVQMKINKQ